MIRLSKTLGIGCATLMLALGIGCHEKIANASMEETKMIYETKNQTEFLTKLKEAFNQANEKTLTDVLQTQFETHEDIQIGDAYKLLHQGVFGNGHIIDERSRGRVYSEFERAQPNKEEKMIELISPKFSIYRINIRPYKAHGGDKETLFEWFYESSKTKTGGIEDFFESWEELKKFLKQNKERNYLSIEEMESVEKVLKEDWVPKNFLPAVSHTEQYRKANSPSYVVVNYEALPAHLKKYVDNK